MDPSILDGTQWHLQIKTESSEIDTGGSNAYPENFNGLILAISRLIEEDYQYELNETSMILELEFEIGGFPAGPHTLILKENKISVTPPPWSYEDAAFSHIPWTGEIHTYHFIPDVRS